MQLKLNILESSKIMHCRIRNFFKKHFDNLIFKLWALSLENTLFNISRCSSWVLSVLTDPQGTLSHLGCQALLPPIAIVILLACHESLGAQRPIQTGPCQELWMLCIPCNEFWASYANSPKWDRLLNNKLNWPFQFHQYIHLCLSLNTCLHWIGHSVWWGHAQFKDHRPS